MKAALDFPNESTMITRKILESRAILVIVLVTPLPPRKHLFSTHTDIKATCLTRSHNVRSMSFFSSAAPSTSKPTFPSTLIHNPFLQGPSHISVQENNSSPHINILGLSIYIPAFPVRLPVLHSPL